MRYLWITLILVFMAAGCARTGATAPAPQVPTVANAPGVTLAPTLVAQHTPTAGSTTTPIFPATPTNAPTTEASATPQRASTSGPALSSGATSSTPVPAMTPGAAPRALAGAKSFTNAAWHIAMDYPADWTAHEDATGTIFTAPGGVTIHLAFSVNRQGSVFEPGQDLPNTRCSPRTNGYGIQERLCLDTIARTYVATALVPPQTLLTLSMRLPGDTGALDTMLASIHPAP